MFLLRDQQYQHDCSGASRRDFLRIGALGLGGWSLPQLLAARANAAPGSDPFRGKSIVVLFLCGGVSQHETFDPKSAAPAEFRCTTGTIQTAIPGVEFGSVYEGLARRADRLAVVHSFAPHGIADHAKAIKHVLTSGSDDGTSIGSRFARFRGPSHPRTGMPSYATLIEDGETDEQYLEDRDRMRVGSRPGGLGLACAPFTPGTGGEISDSMSLSLPVARLNERRELLASFDRFRRQADQNGVMDGMNSFERQAFEVILGGNVRKALDLSHEDPRTEAQYDTSKFQVGWTRKRASTLGQRLLMARRLCQAGCGFVTVGSAGWDNHANGKHPNVHDGMKLLGRPLDKAVSAFLDDLEEQGLSDDILLVITSEFGRTPKLDKNGGRDHWPGLNTLVFAGGGLRTGQVIGESTNKAEVPKSEPIGYDGLLGTLWHTLFDVGQLRLRPGLPRELLTELERVEPIRQLV